MVQILNSLTFLLSDLPLRASRGGLHAQVFRRAVLRDCQIPHASPLTPDVPHPSGHGHACLPCLPTGRRQAGATVTSPHSPFSIPQGN